MFLARTKANIYPDGRKVQDFMEFMSLWNRCVAFLLRHFRNLGEVQVFHALDYHAALAPIYLESWGEKPIPVALTLHNALYQGSLQQTLSEVSSCLQALALTTQDFTTQECARLIGERLPHRSSSGHRKVLAVHRSDF